MFMVQTSLERLHLCPPRPPSTCSTVQPASHPDAPPHGHQFGACQDTRRRSARYGSPPTEPGDTWTPAARPGPACSPVARAAASKSEDGPELVAELEGEPGAPCLPWDGCRPGRMMQARRSDRQGPHVGEFLCRRRSCRRPWCCSRRYADPRSDLQRSLVALDSEPSGPAPTGRRPAQVRADPRTRAAPVARRTTGPRVAGNRGRRWCDQARAAGWDEWMEYQPAARRARSPLRTRLVRPVAAQGREMKKSAAASVGRCTRTCRSRRRPRTRRELLLSAVCVLPQADGARPSPSPASTSRSRPASLSACSVPTARASSRPRPRSAGCCDLMPVRRLSMGRVSSSDPGRGEGSGTLAEPSASSTGRTLPDLLWPCTR